MGVVAAAAAYKAGLLTLGTIGAGLVGGWLGDTLFNEDTEQGEDADDACETDRKRAHDKDKKKYYQDNKDDIPTQADKYDDIRGSKIPGQGVDKTKQNIKHLLDRYDLE